MTDARVAVVGSRTFHHYALLCKTLDELKDVRITQIVSGGAIGADSLGAQYARERKIPLREFLPDWKTHGKKAGFLRNTDIVRESDIVVAFWDGESHGTLDSINKAKEMNKILHVVKF